MFPFASQLIEEGVTKEGIVLDFAKRELDLGVTL
jgi:hypothetical protein